MVDLDDRRLSSLYEYIGFNEELTRMVFKTYDVRKNNYKKYDYSDMLYFFHRMIKENKSVLSRIQTNYKLVVVDECQDWTPLMQDIVDILSNGIDYMQVGDEDQTLYGFNGAEVLGMLNFDEKFKGKTYLLTENRRCPEIIVQAANIIIGDNKQRFHKEIFTKKPGGTIDIKYYKDYTEQLSMVIKQLSSYTMEELENTVVSYRNQYNSILLSEYLYEMGIPFKILGDKSLFEYRLYHHMFTVLDMLNNPHEDERQINLYKVTSLRKSEIKDILGLDKKRSFTRFTGYTNFYDRDFGNISTRKEFNDEINLLKEISTNIDSFPMKTYMWGIWNLFEKHYWNYQLSEAAKKSDYDGTDLIMLNRVKKFFDSDLPYYQFVREYVEKKKLYEDSVRSGQCVTLSTFHSLKGLQYKRQIMLFLDDATFPAMKSIHLENATEEELEDAFEAETRLAYVAMTRPTDELILYAKEDNPSIYVKKIQEFLSTYKPKTSLTSSKSIDMLMKPKSSLNLNKRF
jgi:DNA helicase-2/ATP-dependent DNA helicase PcrA